MIWHLTIQWHFIREHLFSWDFVRVERSEIECPRKILHIGPLAFELCWDR